MKEKIIGYKISLNTVGVLNDRMQKRKNLVTIFGYSKKLL